MSHLDHLIQDPIGGQACEKGSGLRARFPAGIWLLTFLTFLLPVSFSFGDPMPKALNNPLSPPCIPPKFVLHGLSSKSKFLAIFL